MAFGRLSRRCGGPTRSSTSTTTSAVMALPAPGTMRQLLDAVAQIYQDPYDRTRPLWLMYVIEGLEGGRAASICARSTTPSPTAPARRGCPSCSSSRPARRPSRPTSTSTRCWPPLSSRRRRRARRARPSSSRSSARRPLRAPPGRHRPARRRRDGDVGRRPAARPRRRGERRAHRRPAARRSSPAVAAPRRRRSRATAPRCPAGRRCGATAPGTATSRCCRSRSTRRSPRPRASAARSTTGSMTGVVNGAVAYHDERGVPLRTLNTSFVVSTRADKAIGGNSFTPTRFSAPAGPMDPAERFKALSEAMADKRAQVIRAGARSAGLAGLANLLPTSLVTSVARSQAAKMDFATSNLRSAKRRFYMSGARVDEALRVRAARRHGVQPDGDLLRRHVRDHHVHRPGGDRRARRPTRPRRGRLPRADRPRHILTAAQPPGVGLLGGLCTAFSAIFTNRVYTAPCEVVQSSCGDRCDGRRRSHGKTALDSVRESSPVMSGKAVGAGAAQRRTRRVRRRRSPAGCGTSRRRATTASRSTVRQSCVPTTSRSSTRRS